VFEAVAQACGIDWTRDLTSSARGALNRAAAELKLIGATPADVRERAANYTDWLGEDKLTPSALVKHWPQVARVRAARPSERERRSNAAKAAFLAKGDE
jgi:hypothetical protein